MRKGYGGEFGDESSEEAMVVTWCYVCVNLWFSVVFGGFRCFLGLVEWM